VATVVSSGNSGFRDSVGAPGCVGAALTIGSTTKTDGISAFSNISDVVDLLAPGSNINSSVPGAGFGVISGTSMSAPHVAGAVAVLRSRSPAATVDQIQTALQSTGVGIAVPGTSLTLRRINVEAAAASLGGGGPSATWQRLGGVITSDISCTSWSSNRIDCFARGTDNAMYHRWWNGSSWLGWQNLGGVITTAPECVSWGSNRIDCFARGTDNAMYHRWWNGSSWGGWQNLGGVITTRPECVSWGSNRLDCFARGTDNAMYHRWWNGSAWGP
jgi:hypothetical protein